MAEDSTSAAGTTETSSSGDVAAEQRTRFKEAAEKVRERLELTAKALAGLGTTVVSAIGIAKVGDIFPVPEGRWVLAGIVMGAFALMGLVVFPLARRVWRAGQPIIWKPDLALVGLSKREKKLVEELFEDMATLNRAPSFRAYGARGLRLERVSDRLSEQAWADHLRKRAHEIRAEVSAVHARANLRVVRYRSSVALFGLAAFVLYFFFFVGLVVFAAGSDLLQSERSEEIEIAKSCAEAREAGASDLPEICGEEEEKTDAEEEESPRQEVERAREELVARLSACEALVAQDSSLNGTACQPLRDAVALLLGGS